MCQSSIQIDCLSYSTYLERETAQDYHFILKTVGDYHFILKADVVDCPSYST